MSEESGARILRMVRYKSVLQDAERLRDPTSQDPWEALSRIIHMGDAQHAHLALVEWLEHQIQDLEKDPALTARRLDALVATFREMDAKIDGRQAVMTTELGYYSQNVAPDYGAKHYDFKDWATPSQLRRVFDEGHEIVIRGHVGTGKTHLAAKFAELLLKAIDGSIVITNIAGFKDKSGSYATRIHHVSLLSEILRIWAKLPAETRIILVLDEPESNLRGGTSRGVKVFNDFRYMLRKLGFAKIEIWHSEGEIYKTLREDDSVQIHRVFKDDKSSFQLSNSAKEDAATKRIENVPGLEFIEFATRGMGSLAIDVSMQSIINRLAKLETMEQMKSAVLAALEDSRTYMDEYREEAEGASPRARVDRETILGNILANAARYLTPRKAFDAGRIREDFNLPWRLAQGLAREAHRRSKTAPAPKPDGPKPDEST